jgi:hypothetical protein
MADDHPLETVHERRITWGLMAIVVAFVLLMTGIVLWVTATLIRNELGGSGPPPSPSPAAIETLPPTRTPTPPNPTLTGAPEPTEKPTLVDASPTPTTKLKRYVKFLYWYLSPGKITLGECVKITWETENAVSLKLYRNGELILDNAPASMTFEDCPTQLGYTVYRMVSVNRAGESNWIQLQVRVVEPP